MAAPQVYLYYENDGLRTFLQLVTDEGDMIALSEEQYDLLLDELLEAHDGRCPEPVDVGSDGESLPVSWQFWLRARDEWKLRVF